MKFNTTNNSLAAFLFFLVGTMSAQVSSETVKSAKPVIYLLPDGKEFSISKFDSLENAWGKGRVSFLHDSRDESKSVVHLQRITDETLQEMEERKIAQNQTFNNMLNTMAPDFELKDLQGNSWSLKSFQGKVVVLNFWFISCAPCIQEMPELNKLVKTFENKDVVFLGLTFNNQKQVEGFLTKRVFDYKLLPNSKEVDKKYNIQSWPTSMVIDQKGFIKMIIQSSPKIKEELENAINKLQ